MSNPTQCFPEYLYFSPTLPTGPDPSKMGVHGSRRAQGRLSTGVLRPPPNPNTHLPQVSLLHLQAPPVLVSSPSITAMGRLHLQFSPKEPMGTLLSLLGSAPSTWLVASRKSCPHERHSSLEPSMQRGGAWYGNFSD